MSNLKNLKYLETEVKAKTVDGKVHIAKATEDILEKIPADQLKEIEAKIFPNIYQLCKYENGEVVYNYISIDGGETPKNIFYKDGDNKYVEKFFTNTYEETYTYKKNDKGEFVLHSFDNQPAVVRYSYLTQSVEKEMYYKDGVLDRDDSDIVAYVHTEMVSRYIRKTPEGYKKEVVLFGRLFPPSDAT